MGIEKKAGDLYDRYHQLEPEYNKHFDAYYNLYENNDEADWDQMDYHQDHMDRIYDEQCEIENQLNERGAGLTSFHLIRLLMVYSVPQML